jgi:nucleoid-associated protein YgaU
MKKTYKLLYVLLLSIFVIGCASPERDFSNLPDQELTKDEAVLRIQKFQANVNDLQNKYQMKQQEVAALKTELSNTNAAIKDCQETYYQLIGATEADIEAFRQKLGAIEGKIRQMQRIPNDELADMKDQVKALEDELNALRMNKIAILPEFYDRIIKDARDIKGLYREKKIKSYTVGKWSETRDCLWNIAGNTDIYGDPFLWPKIWQNNTDQIKNPDIIHPGQVLVIPPPGPKTPEEMKAERRYWRKKREAMENAETPVKGK